MVIFKIIIAYLLPWIFGYLLINSIDKNKVLNQGLKLFAAFPMGMGVFTLEAFTAGILGARLGLGTFLIIILADIGVLELFIYWQTGKWFWPAKGETGKNGDKGKWTRGVILFLLLIKVIASVWQVTHIPTYEFDAWNNWNLRAKVIYVEQEIPLDKSDPFYLGGGIKSYPLNDGLWKVWIANMIGKWDENLAGLGSVVFYVVLLGIFYFSLPRNFSRVFKFLCTYLLASLPFLYFHSWIPYADLEFAVYLFLTVVAFSKFLSPHLSSPTGGEESKEGASVWLPLSAIALALTIWTKNEGFVVVLPMLLPLTTVLVITKTVALRNYLKYWLIALVIVSPWLFFRFINELEFLSGDSGSFNFVYNSQFVNEAWHSIFLRSHFNFLWILVFSLIIFKFKKIWQDMPMRFSMITLASLFLFYNSIIIFTDKALDLSALVRVNLHIAPIGLFLMVLILAEIIPFGKAGE